MRNPALLLILALLCLPVVAFAQEKSYMLEAGAGFSKNMEDGAPDGSLGLQAGVTYRVPSSPEFGLGAEVGYLMLGGEKHVYSSSCVPVTGQVYYFFQPSSTSLFLTGGLGMYQFRIDYENSVPLSDVSDTKFGLNLGAGLIFGRGDSQLRFGVDGRLHMVMTEGDNTNMIALLGRIYF